MHGDQELGDHWPSDALSGRGALLLAGVNDETTESKTTDTAKPLENGVAAAGPKEEQTLTKQRTFNPRAWEWSALTLYLTFWAHWGCIESPKLWGLPPGFCQAQLMLRFSWLGWNRMPAGLLVGSSCRPFPAPMALLDNAPQGTLQSSCSHSGPLHGWRRSRIFKI